MKIIFICTGNTCRSPMAEGYLKSKNLTGVTVLSRGLCADGSPVSKNSKTVMGELGIDISAHVSKNLSPEDLDADLFVCMSTSHKAALLSLGIEEQKVLTFDFSVPDPFGEGETVYRLCRDRIIDGVDALLFDGKILPLSVQRAEPDDIKAITALETECFSVPWNENMLFESFRAGTVFFVAKMGDKTVGYAGISCIAGEGYITNIAVFKEYRRQNAASLLINRLLTLARQTALEFITLEVRPSNDAAKSLYEKFGFVTEGRRKDFYTAPKEDALIMTRRFMK